jgi:hypothetical protein
LHPALAGRYRSGTRRLPVALLQLNLKLPPAVLADWRAQAAAQGLSVRDWLVSITAPPADPETGPPGRGALADRVAQLEALTAGIGQALAQLEALRQAPRSPARVSPAPRSGDAPSPVRVMPAAAELPPGGIETAALADRLGMRRGTLNARIARAGGAAPGLVVEGWRCLGMRTPERGGPARALWEPAEG